MLTRPVVLLLLASLGAFSGFFLLLSVVPLYAAEIGGQTSGAGFVTGALMLSTVATQLVTPWVLGRLGYRTVLASGLILLGTPAFLFVWATGLPAILGATLLRGIGFGLVTVVGAALIAELVPEGRRGAGIGLYGLAVGLPNILVLPLGVWLVGVIGYDPVFLAGALAPLAALPAALLILAPHPESSGGSTERLTGLLNGRLMRLFMIFFGATLASGVVVTFLPLAISGGVASAALFSQATTTTIARWLAGVFGDRFGPRRLLLPGVLATGLGVLTPAWTENAALIVAGMALFGAGFGILQNITLVLMFERVGARDYGPVSAMWNIAFDAGTGFGAATLGLVAQYAGFGTAFSLTSALVLATLVLVSFEARKKRESLEQET